MKSWLLKDFSKSHFSGAKAFEFSKRKFIFSSIGFLGVLPFSQFFTFQHKRGYLFCASINSSDLPKEDSKYMRRSAFRLLKNKMLHQKKLLSFHHYRIPSQKRTVWIYVFDSRKSFLEWRGEVKARGMFVSEYLPSHLRYSVKTFNFSS